MLKAFHDNIQPILLILTTIVGLTGFAFSLKNDIQTNAANISVLKVRVDKLEVDHDIIIEIRTDLKQIKETLDRKFPIR